MNQKFSVHCFIALLILQLMTLNIHQIVKIYGLKQEGGELFIKYFRKL